MKNGMLRIAWDYDYIDCADFRLSYTIRLAINMSKNNTTAKILEKHGSRWYTLGECKEGKLIPKGKVKDYFILPIDQYGQPNGNVEVEPLTKIEAIWKKDSGVFIFDNYSSAMYRAMD